MFLPGAELKNSIEILYEVFSIYLLKDKIDGCPCCVHKQDRSILHSKPLRELSGDDLSKYCFKAMTTFGDADDFKHFLPRLLEIMVEGDLACNEEILFKKINHADWRLWNEQERSAIRRFFNELFSESIEFDEEYAFLTEAYLIGIALCVDDITPYLDIWLKDLNENKLATLRYFIVDDNYSMSNPFISDQPDKRNQIINWMISKEVNGRLEELFQNSDDENITDHLSQILDTIEELR